MQRETILDENSILGSTKQRDNHYLHLKVLAIIILICGGNPLYSYFHLPITRQQILDSSKLKEFSDDNFKFDENSRKLSKRVENTVGKGEIARYEQFLLFPQCFQKAYFPGVSKGVIVWTWVNIYILYF